MERTLLYEFTTGMLTVMVFYCTTWWLLLSYCRWTEGLLGPGLLLQRGLCSEPILSNRAGPRRNPPSETKA